VALDQFARPWSGPAFRHIPATSTFGVLDFRFAGSGATNRWNYQNSPTLYLASDPAVGLAEFARHLREERSAQLSRGLVERTQYRLQVMLSAVLDLRESALTAPLSLSGAPHCFLDRRIARSTAEFLRRTTVAQGLFVPSMALLDQADRWILVLFLDKLPRESGRFITAVDDAGRFSVEL